MILKTNWIFKGERMIKKAGNNDLETLAKLASEMWHNHSINELINEFSEIMINGNHSVEELNNEFSDLFMKEEAQFFLKYENDIPVGFAQCQLRYDYVEGTSTSPVGYLEGIFVKESYRSKGYAKELLTECEVWAKGNGCQEFASDCEIDNINSLHFHKAMNFTEANRIICFTKLL